MATLTISSGTGETLFLYPLSGLRAKDDAFDNRSGGGYMHRADEFSATEANEWQSLWYYTIEQLKRGGTCIDAYANVPLVPGPVAVVGYHSGKFLMGITDAGNNIAADAFTLATVASGAAFVAQLGCIISGCGLDATGAAVGDPVWLGTSGSMTLTMPSQCQQKIGYTLDQLASGFSTIAAMPLFAKFQPLITSGLVVSGAMGNGAVVSGNVASGQLGSAHLANGAVWSGNIASGAITSGAIASGGIDGIGRTVTYGPAPTVTATGFGTSPTITVETGSSDVCGRATIQMTGATAYGSGVINIAFSSAYGTNPPVCFIQPCRIGSGVWQSTCRIMVDSGTSNTDVNARWLNVGALPLSGIPYGIQWLAFGK